MKGLTNRLFDGIIAERSEERSKSDEAQEKIEKIEKSS